MNKNNGKEPEVNMGEDPIEKAEGMTSVLREGRFSNAGSTLGRKARV